MLKLPLLIFKLIYTRLLSQYVSITPLKFLEISFTAVLVISANITHIVHFSILYSLSYSFRRLYDTITIH